MPSLLKNLLAVVFGVICLTGSVLAGLPATQVNLPAINSSSFSDDDDEPDITDRVARISFIEGKARIRRSSSEDWETLTLNLPVVEGNEISTDDDSRIEIQFDKNKHLRLDSNSYLKIVTLKDQGIAVSISLGSMSLRITSFDKASSFFEIDAPKTTLAVQKAGRYRIDAGKEGEAEVRASVSQGGEARIYSDNAGFTLKNDRSTRIYVDGPNAGEWENGNVDRFDDEFSNWASDRENVVAKRLKDAFYDKYYDDDIYGADDLNDNGEWINTSDYGYVWSPNRVALAQYSDWSPYRYGNWRWMSPYGWIWVNDEPWGWATYHHGRWFSYNGRWVWSPYGYYRSSRSWWSPALVVINIFNSNVCWYPLPYHHRRYNYNWNHQSPTKSRKIIAFDGGPTRIVPPGRVTGRGKFLEDVPATGVVTVGKDDFGNGRARIKTAPPVIAKTVLAKDPGTGNETNLPSYKDRRIGLDVGTEKPKFDPAILQTRVGAAPRKTDAPMDDELRNKRIFGGRPPQKEPLVVDPVREPGDRPIEPRKTGAVERPPIVRQPDPVKSPTDTERERPKRIQTVREVPTYTPPTPVEKQRTPQQPRETPRYDQPKQPERPHIETPVRQTPKGDPPPSKGDSKPEEKPAPPSRKEKPDSR